MIGRRPAYRPVHDFYDYPILNIPVPIAAPTIRILAFHSTFHIKLLDSFFFHYPVCRCLQSTVGTTRFFFYIFVCTHDSISVVVWGNDRLVIPGLIGVFSPSHVNLFTRGRSLSFYYVFSCERGKDHLRSCTRPPHCRVNMRKKKKCRWKGD